VPDARRLSDRELATWIGVALFVAMATPLAFVRQPPYQDLNGHLATVTIISHMGEYPEYVFNGFLKTNSALVAFTYFVGKWIGIREAGRLFAMLVLATNAIVLPRFVLRFGGRERMLASPYFMAPMVHNWFVSMGMLNFALGFSLALVVLVALDRQREAPSLARGLGVAALALLSFYAYPMPLVVVGLLVAVHCATQSSWGARLASARALALPLVPAAAIVVYTGVVHMAHADPHADAGAPTEFAPATWLLYNLWAHFLYGYTMLSASSLLLAIVLAVFAIRHARERVPFFSPVASAVLLAAYAFAPYFTVGLGYAGSRIVPFLWMAALVRVPTKLPRALAGVLGAAAALYVVGMACDQLRLAREEAEVGAGVEAMPMRAKMAVFDFSPRITSKNTWSLTHAWGLYVVERHTSASEVWADSPSLPITRKEPPPPRLEPVRMHAFAETMRTRRAFCDARARLGPPIDRCDEMYESEWAAYWRDVTPLVDRVLMWDPPPDTLEQVPASWRISFQRGRLWIFAKGR
jgi:hypothetical protein